MISCKWCISRWRSTLVRTPCLAWFLDFNRILSIPTSFFLQWQVGDKLKRVLQLQKLQLHRMQPGFDTGRAEVSLWRPSLPVDITRPMRVKVVSCRTAGTSALANGFVGAESQKVGLVSYELSSHKLKRGYLKMLPFGSWKLRKFGKKWRAYRLRCLFTHLMQQLFGLFRTSRNRVFLDSNCGLWQRSRWCSRPSRLCAGCSNTIHVVCIYIYIFFFSVLLGEPFTCAGGRRTKDTGHFEEIHGIGVNEHWILFAFCSAIMTFGRSHERKAGLHVSSHPMYLPSCWCVLSWSASP